MPEDVIKQLFAQIEQNFIAWIRTKPTGNYGISITVNEGGIRGKSVDKGDYDSETGVSRHITEKL